MMNPSEDQAALIIERGLAAGKLLDDPTFAAVVDDLTNFNLSALVAARPGESGREARDYHHLMQFALTEICAELTMRKAAGEQMADALNDHKDFD